jgi:hypothetical protein
MKNYSRLGLGLGLMFMNPQELMELGKTKKEKFTFQPRTYTKAQRKRIAKQRKRNKAARKARKKQ